MQNHNSNLKTRSFNFSVQVINFVDRANLSNPVNLVTIKQLIRCATSVGANIIEAQAASSKRDFTNFMTIALKSANETVYWLELMKIVRPKYQTPLQNLAKEATELGRMLAASVLTLKGKRHTI